MVRRSSLRELPHPRRDYGSGCLPRHRRHNKRHSPLNFPRLSDTLNFEWHLLLEQTLTAGSAQRSEAHSWRRCETKIRPREHRESAHVRRMRPTIGRGSLSIRFRGINGLHPGNELGWAHFAAVTCPSFVPTPIKNDRHRSSSVKTRI